jgi:hypothetical protein
MFKKILTIHREKNKRKNEKKIFSFLILSHSLSFSPLFKLLLYINISFSILNILLKSGENGSEFENGRETKKPV